MQRDTVEGEAGARPARRHFRAGHNKARHRAATAETDGQAPRTGLRRDLSVGEMLVRAQDRSNALKERLSGRILLNHCA
jgi:hypothetical protein